MGCSWLAEPITGPGSNVLEHTPKTQKNMSMNKILIYGPITSLSVKLTYYFNTYFHCKRTWPYLNRAWYFIWGQTDSLKLWVWLGKPVFRACCDVTAARDRKTRPIVRSCNSRKYCRAGGQRGAGVGGGSNKKNIIKNHDEFKWGEQRGEESELSSSSSLLPPSLPPSHTSFLQTRKTLCKQMLFTLIFFCSKAFAQIRAVQTLTLPASFQILPQPGTHNSTNTS